MAPRRTEPISDDLTFKGKDIMVETRKIITLRETIFSELGVEAARSITRAVGMAVIRNPFAGKFVEENAAGLRASVDARQSPHRRPMAIE
jgi:hypothetical protein